MEIKRTAVFFANSRLRVVGRGDGGRKRVVLDNNKERFVQKKAFWFVKTGDFQVRIKSFVQKKAFDLRKRAAFSVHAKLSDKEKLFTNTAKLQLPTAPKLTSSCKYHLRQLTVSLQYNNSFSKNNGLASAV